MALSPPFIILQGLNSLLGLPPHPTGISLSAVSYVGNPLLLLPIILLPVRSVSSFPPPLIDGYALIPNLINVSMTQRKATHNRANPFHQPQLTTFFSCSLRLTLDFSGHLLVLSGQKKLCR